MDTIILHATAGAEETASSAAGALSTLRQRGLSYHYIIAKDGTIYKCVPYRNVAFHAGNSYGPHEEERGISNVQDGAWFVEDTSVNPYTVGISFVNLDDGSDPFTDDQLQAADDLIQQLKEALPLKWISTHWAVSPKRKIDPNQNNFAFRHFADRVGLEAWGG